MAKQRCIYCEMPEGDGHSVRCAVTKSNAPAVYEESEHEIRAERDRFRSGLRWLEANAGGYGGHEASAFASDVLDIEGQPDFMEQI